MRSLSLLLILSVVWVAGCGDDSGDGEDTDGSPGSSSSGAGGGGTASDNGCSADGYTAATSIAFGGPEIGTAYEPRCVSVAVGGTVTWTGDFSAHPIVGGTIEGMMKMPDGESPIKVPAAGAMELKVTFTEAGTYPFYCDPHGPVGMNGAVKVE